jgi:hypothetical protein
MKLNFLVLSLVLGGLQATAADFACAPYVDQERVSALVTAPPSEGLTGADFSVQWSGAAQFQEGYMLDLVAVEQGAIFNRKGKKLRDLPTENAPVAALHPCAVWWTEPGFKNAELLLWGGFRGATFYKGLKGYGLAEGGAIYNVEQNRWRPITKKGAPPLPTDLSTLSANTSRPRESYHGEKVGNEFKVCWKDVDKSEGKEQCLFYDPRADYWHP